MDKIFLRNFFLFILILFICSGSLIFGLIKSERELAETDKWVLHTNTVITKSEDVSTAIEGMLSSQRGYLLTADKSFLTTYDRRKLHVSENLADLADLTMDNPSQQMRLKELQSYFIEFSKKLENRSQNVSPDFFDNDDLNEMNAVNAIRNNISMVNGSFLAEEYELLQKRVEVVSNKKSQYFYILLIGVVIGSILLLIFNGFLFRAQSKRTLVEELLKETEDRFALAVEGAQDGIFDWDIKKQQVFFSKRYFELLGENQGPLISTTDEFKSRIHPEDAPKVWSYVEQYLAGGLSEYIQEFRMKHKSGRCVWIQSRAKALFDKDGQAVRMVGAHTDISHIVVAQEKLKHEKAQAEKANHLKSEFLAHMSYEIRTPLTAISGIAEIMQRNQANFDQKQKQLVNTLNSSTASLKDLINDILDFSRIESGELELDNETFNLQELFESVISMMSLRAGELGVEFIFDFDKIKEHNFFGDKKRLRQILVNLIGNGLKFTDKGSVTVAAYYEEREGDEFLRIDVSDTGIGIAPENFDIVFERFKQADLTVSRKYGGTGLGLPISRNLAQLMGGDIFVTSQLGSGSKFSIVIPQKLSGQQPKTDYDKTIILKMNDRIKQNLKNETKILLVEDYEGNIVVIGYLLDDLGISYDIAKTGIQALEAWKKNHYDIVLMDIQMPEMDGFAATSEIRAIEKEKELERTPIIGMTAHALVGDKDKCIEAGMDSYLPKPIVEADLKRQILSYIN